MSQDENRGAADPIGSTNSLLAALAAPPAAGNQRFYAPGEVVAGRYEVRGLLGKGGMGLVYLAHDTQLERDVALKVQLRADVEDAKKRLESEAKALARLSHPNVVTVHEVGQVEGQLFIAMEYVEGQTLADWLRTHRSVKEIVKRYTLAGQGLVAAHEVSLIHRDFKPGNVLLGKDGRVKVADFGIALLGSGQTEPVEPSGAQGSEDPPSGHHGAAGERIVGTPAYMAPEQLKGHAVDARADQFSFCVSLFESVTGHRPFMASTLEAVLGKIDARELDPDLQSQRIPGWLRRALQKGLASRPDDRFSTMAELVAELEAGPKRVRLGWSLAVLVLLFALVAAASAALFGDSGQRACQGAQEQVAAVWNSDARAALERSFAASGKDNAPAVKNSVLGSLDRWAKQWSQEHTRACEATRVFAQQSEQALDLRMACMERKLGEFKAVVGVVGELGDSLADQSIDLVGSLSDPRMCADSDRLGRIQPLPKDPAMADAVRIAQQKVTEAMVLLRAGRFESSRKLLDETAAQARAGYLPLQGRWAFTQAHLDLKSGRVKPAEQWLTDTVRVAAASGDDLLLFDVMTDLAFLLANNGAKPEQADPWLDLAEVVWSRLGQDPALMAHLDGNKASIRMRQGRYTEAVAAAKRMVRFKEGNGDPVSLARALTTLGMALVANDELKPGQAALERALALLTTQAGLEHPATQDVILNLSVAYKNSGNYSAAIAMLRKAIEVIERTQGPDSQNLADHLENLSVMLLEQGKLDEARRLHERSLAIVKKAYGADSTQVALALGNLAIQLETAGHHELAYGYAQESMQILSKALGDDHPILVNADCILGTIARSLKKFDESAQALERAKARAERIFGAGHPGRINPLVELARTEIARGNIDAALRLTEAARVLAESDRTPARMRPDVWFAMAEARWSRTQMRKSALGFACKAKKAWAELGYKEELVRANQWLASRSANDGLDPCDQAQ